jgi:hypothetical protein
MQVHYYGGKETMVDHGTNGISFVIVSTVVRMSVHLANVGLYAAMLTFGVARGLSLVNVFTTSTFVNTMNNVSPTIVSIDQKNGFI